MYDIVYRKQLKEAIAEDKQYLFSFDSSLYDLFMTGIDEVPAINLEDLPVVRELRKELERVTMERDALIWDMKIVGSGCYSCKHFDASKGKCRAEEPCGVNNNWEWRGIQETQEE